MTTFAVPSAGSPDWRAIHPTPPNALLYTVGPYCPIDDTTLQEQSDGFGCPTCLAAWNFHGLAGRWLPRPASVELRRLDRRLATTIGVGFGGALASAAGLQLQPFADAVPTELILAVALVLVLAAGAIVAWAWLAGRVERARYAGNTIVATYDSVEQALAAPIVPEQVSDDQ